ASAPALPDLVREARASWFVAWGRRGGQAGRSVAFRGLPGLRDRSGEQCSAPARPRPERRLSTGSMGGQTRRRESHAMQELTRTLVDWIEIPSVTGEEGDYGDSLARALEGAGFAVE